MFYLHLKLPSSMFFYADAPSVVSLVDKGILSYTYQSQTSLLNHAEYSTLNPQTQTLVRLPLFHHPRILSMSPPIRSRSRQSATSRLLTSATRSISVTWSWPIVSAPSAGLRNANSMVNLTRPWNVPGASKVSF